MNTSERYIRYLNTEAKQYNGVVEKPARDSTIEKFISIAKENNTSEQKARDLIVSALNEDRKVLCWSDHHFNHDMLWKKGLRNFSSREEMNNTMLNALCAIKPDDVVLFGGDLCFYNFKDILAEINKVKCQKIYVVGNHDIRDKALLNSLRSSFEAVTISFDFQHEPSFGDKNILVSHYPVAASHLLDNEINLHGHTHQHLMGLKHLNMCVEHTGYKLKELREFF